MEAKTEAGEEMSKRYIVFERPLGSKCWTMVMRQNGSKKGTWIPVDCVTELAAKQYISGWKQMDDDIDYHIAEVELPE